MEQQENPNAEEKAFSAAEELSEEKKEENSSVFSGDEIITPETNICDSDKITLAKEKKSKSFFQRFLYQQRKIFSIRDDVAEHEEIRTRLVNGGKMRGTNMIVMICAILIASVGLITNSVAVIIGAMLVSPLMSRILLMAYGTSSNDRKLFFRGLGGLFLQGIITVSVSTLFFLAVPNKEWTEQLLARTEPSFYDVIIALAGGVAGIVAMTRKDSYSNVIPGVAIATAIMPPLCTVGFSLANSHFIEMGYAFYLFFINAFFIYSSAVVVLDILNVPKVRTMTVKDWRKRRMRMIRNTVLVLVPMIVLVTLMLLKIIPGYFHSPEAKQASVATSALCSLRK